MEKKYSEQLLRHPARDAQGRAVEVLERITFARTVGSDGRVRGRRVEVNRRFDLKTGERLVRISDSEFEDDESGARILLDPSRPA